jgi:hypothetical protein
MEIHGKERQEDKVSTAEQTHQELALHLHVVHKHHYAELHFCHGAYVDIRQQKYFS